MLLQCPIKRDYSAEWGPVEWAEQFKLRHIVSLEILADLKECANVLGLHHRMLYKCQQSVKRRWQRFTLLTPSASIMSARAFLYFRAEMMALLPWSDRESRREGYLTHLS